MFSFCPGKATWDHNAASLLKLLETTYITRSLYVQGAISDQPAWYIELLDEFLGMYDDYRFAQQQKMIWGDGSGSKKGGTTTKTPPRRK